MSNQLSHHQRYLIEEFAEAYADRRMARRELLRRVLLLTGSVPLTASMLLALGCGDSSGDTTAPAATVASTTGPAAAITPGAGVGPGVSPTDPSIVASDVRYKGEASDVLGYLARPAAAGSYPGILIIHENQGLLEHFKDVARRFAKEGFVGLAVDLISRQGGTTSDMAAVMAAYRVLTSADFVSDMMSSLGYLKTQSFVRPAALGVTGFCFGGNEVWDITFASPDIKAAVPFYGMVDQDEYAKIAMTKADILVMYGGADTRVTAQRPMVEEQLKASGQPYDIKVYDGAPHAFFNDTRTSYNAVAATDSWNSMLAWFRKYLAA